MNASSVDSGTNKPVLVFDIGGVLYENIGFDVLQQLTGKSAQETRDLWLNCKTVDLFETGRIGPEEFGNAIVKDLHFDLSPQQFLDEFVTWPKGFYQGAQALIAELRKTHTVGCFSNSNVLHWREEFDAMFDFALASHRIGVAKPKQAAFHYLKKYLQETVGESSGNTCFFDDSQTNIEAGREAGLNAMLAYGFDELVEVLDRENIYKSQ